MFEQHFDRLDIGLRADIVRCVEFVPLNGFTSSMSEIALLDGVVLRAMTDRQISRAIQVLARRAAPKHSEKTRAILRAYRLPKPDETDAVRMLHSLFHGYVSLETAGGFRHIQRAADASWDKALDALDSLLRNWPRGSA